jgi:hypothetical protein
MADPATATGTSSVGSRGRVRALVAALALAGAATLAACGSSEPEGSGQAAPANPQAFSWLHPAPRPAGWRVRPLPSGKATLAYPPDWKLTRTDPGTVTAAIKRGGAITGYLNITPQGGDETLANWASFRPAHNREEGDEDLVSLASDTGLRFHGGGGSCVADRYATDAGHHYREIACIVRGSTATTVIVGAAPVAHWDAMAPTLERAVSSFVET